MMTVFDKLPGWLKAAIGIGILLVGPVMVITFWLGGTQAAIIAILSIMIYFMVLYIVGVRRYIERR
jgi:hypothetical protein